MLKWVREGFHAKYGQEAKLAFIITIRVQHSLRTVQAVAQWTDQATAVVQNMTQYNSVALPTYNNVPGQFINFNPNLQFVPQTSMIGYNGTDAYNEAAQTIFLVASATSIGSITTIGGWAPTMEWPGWYFNGTINYWDYGSWPGTPANGLAVNRPFILGCSYSISGGQTTSMDMRNNGQSNYCTNCTANTMLGASGFYLGDDQNWGTTFGGKMSECIIFKSVLTQAQMQLVDSYLAIKYGITLYGNATSSNPLVTDGNYYLSSGATVWTYPGYAAYHNEVAGIARDDASALYQKVSSTVFNTTNNALIISTDNNFTAGNYDPARTTGLVNGQALLFGNDQNSTTATQTTSLDLTTYLRRVQRTWKTENTGSVGPVNLYFPTLPALAAGEFYVALTDATSNFTTGSTAIGTSKTTTFTNVTVPNGINYFTIAIASLKVEYDSAATSCLEHLGCDIPRLLIKGLAVGNNSITISDLGTGSATSGTDYTLSPIVVNIPAGHYDGTMATSLPVPLTIIDDCYQEPNETINLALGATTGVVGVGDANGDATTQSTTTYTILNDDFTPLATIAGTTTVCQNTAPPTITFTGSGGTAPYYFTYSIDGGTTYSLSTATTIATTTVATTTAGTHTVSLLTVADSKTYTTTCITTLTVTATVFVNPAPAINSMTVASCAGSSFTSTPVNVTNGIVPAGTTYTWGLPTVTGGATGATTGTNQTNITQTLNNPTTSVQTATYSITPTSGIGCVGAPYILTATMSAPVHIFDTTLATICSGNSFSLTPVTGIPDAATVVAAGTTYNWTAPTVTGGMTGASAQTNQTLINQTLFNPTTTQQTATYTVTPYSGGCPSPVFKIIIPVNPSPTATIIGTTTVCFGATAPNVTFTGITGNAPYKFVYSLNGTTQTVNAPSTTTTVAVSTGISNVFTYSLISVADNLCSQPQSGSAVITVNPLPTATVVGTTTVCQNSTSPNIVFTGASATAPYLFTYSINGVGSQTVSSIAGTTASVSVPTGTVTTYTYNLIRVQEGSSAACIQNQTGSASVEVRAPSQGTVTASVHRICQNSASPSMVFNGSSGTPPYTFYYTIKSDVNGTTTNSVISTGSTATVQVSTANADTLVYTITNIQDASGIICGIGGSFDTTVIDPLPKSTITAALNDVCLGDPVQTITFTSIGVPAPVTFNYFTSVNGGANVAQPAINSPTTTATISAPATTLGTTIYTNGISKSNVCTGSGNGSARLTVNPIPTASLSLTGSSTICQSGGASQVTFTGSIGHPPFVFNYNIDGAATTTITTLSGQNSVVLPLAALAAGTHTVNLLSVKDTFNCSQPQTGSVTVTVDPLPTASAGGLGSICMNGTATVSGASAANGSINWSSNGTGAGTITNATGLTPSYAAAASDAGKTVTLTMTVTSTNTCNPNTATAQYTVNVDSLPLATAGGIKTICENASVTISGAIAKYGSILWTGNGLGTISNATTLTPSYAAVAGDAGNTVLLTMTVSSTNSCAPQTATATYTITVDHLPTATITGSSTICENSTATVSTASQSYGTPSWTWNGAGSITAGVNTLTPTYTAAAGDAGKAVTLTMTVTSTNTCASQTASANYIVNVDHLPIATITGSTTICENSTTTISTASQSYGTPSWTENGAGSITSGVNTLTPTYTAATGDAGNAVILTMTVTSTNTCASQTATASYTINVDHLPTATTTNSATICENASYTLKNGEAIQSYGSPKWTANGAGSITSGANTLTPTYSANTLDAGNAVTLTMTVTSTNTCSNATATANYIINVDHLPTATAGTPQTICQGNTATIAGAKSGNGTINWTANGQGTLTNSGTLNPQYTSTPADAGNTVSLTMTVTSTNSCALSISTSTTSVITSINVRPALTATVTAPQRVCQNSTAQVVFTITIQGTAPYTFNYTENGATKTVSTINGNNVAVVGVSTSNAVPVIYNLSHVQDANCQQTVAASATMTVLPLPDATISQNEDVCRDSMPKAILFKGLNGAKPYTFTFTINNDSVTQSADSVYSTNPATDKTGTSVYTLTNVTDGNNCSKTLNQTATVVVHENPHAIFTISPEHTSILEPTITITDASIATTSWYWDFGDKNLSPSPNPKEHTYADTGTYKMKLIVSNGSCKDSTYEIVRITLPTSLYVPNTFSPNGDGVNDVFKAEGDGITTFEMMIYDRWGQLVFQSTDINKGWDGKVNGGSEVAAMDTYVYVINITAFANKHNYTYRGVVNLMK